MTARILRLALALELLIYAVFFSFLGSLMGWQGGRIFLAVVGLVLAVRLWVIATTFAVAWKYRSPRSAGQAMDPFAATWMFLREYASMLALFLVIQPFERWFMGEDRVLAGQGGGERPPVLLVHGYGCNRGSWWWMRSRLEKIGLRVATVNLEPLYGSIDDYVEPLRKRIEALCAETGAPQVSLVGHSMGGLACRAYLEQHGEARVARLITLGTPHHGTRLARYGLGRNARQMEPGSPWLQALNQAGLPEGLAAIALYSVHDNFVMPQDLQYLENADNRPLVGIAHLEMLFSAHIETALVAALG